MTPLKIEIVNRPCAFVMQITDTVETLKNLAMFFQGRHIIIDNMQMHRCRGDGALIIIHCKLERDRINRTFQLLQQLPGVAELEKMEGK